MVRPTTYRLIGPLLAASLAAQGCLEELPSPSRVDSLRILGVQAEPPEVPPGDAVTLSALAVDAIEQRALSYRWAACLLPERAAGFFGGSTAANSGGGGYGLEDPGNCVTLLDAGAPDIIDLGTKATATLDVPSDFFDDLSIVKAAYGLPTDTDIPDVLLTGLLAIAGMNLTVTLEVRAGDEVLTAYKRINVSLAPPDDINRNPSGLAFVLYDADDEDEVEIPDSAAPPPDGRCFVGESDGTALTVSPGTYRIAPVNVPDPPTLYQVILPALDPETPFELIEAEETLFHSFFSTQGTFDRDIVKATPSTRGEWVLSELSEPVDVWIVTRDGRGGLDWCYSSVAPDTAP